MRLLSPIILVVLLATSAVARDRDFRPRRVVAAFPAITDAKFLAAADVTDQVTDDELVLGVALDGKARAYPINMLTGPRREIINDVLAGSAIAATW